jgi:hypothetical protein
MAGAKRLFAGRRRRQETPSGRGAPTTLFREKGKENDSKGRDPSRKG